MPEIIVDFSVYFLHSDTFFTLMYDVCASKLERLILDNNKINHVYFKGSRICVDVLSNELVKDLIKSRGYLVNETPVSYVLPKEFAFSRSE